MRNSLKPLFLLVFLAACAGSPDVTRTQAVVAGDAPFDRVLVAALFADFDYRRFLEREIVKELKARGVDGVAMTSMSDTRTVLDRETVVDRVGKTGTDAVLVMQLVDYKARAKIRDANPEATYNYWPTYWYNVFEVELTEYVEPTYIQFTDKVQLSAAVYSVASEQRVWAIETDFSMEQDMEFGMDYTLFVDEAEAIVRAMARDDLIGK